MAEVQETKEEDDGLGGMKWECMCVTLEDYQDYMSSIRKSRDANEKALYKRIEEEILPELAKVAEEQAKKEARRMKELEVLQKLATAKRSSRISARMEKQKEVEEAEEAERKRQAELAKARAEQDRQRKLEEVSIPSLFSRLHIDPVQAHESRRMTREQRLRERETAKILKEEEVRKMEEDQEKIEAKQARLSERHLKTQMKKRQEELRRLNEEDYWVFDCEKCGLHGECLVLVSIHGSPSDSTDPNRRMGLPKSPATSAVFGNTADATAFRITCLRTSLSSARLANAKQTWRTSRSFHLSN